MPWFSQRRAHTQTERQQLDQMRSIRAVEDGKIGSVAQRRLQTLGERTSLSTSNLSVQDLYLTASAGIRPLAQVSGSSLYYTGVRPGGTDRPMQRADTMTRVFNECRGRAVGRLRQEAAMVEANAIVGVRVVENRYEWGKEIAEFTLTGTAVQVTELPTFREPVATNLSVGDVWKLLEAGYAPRGLVIASWVTSMVGGAQTEATIRSYVNAEIETFTQGVYRARRHVIERAEKQAQEWNAEGIVGMVVEHVQIEQETETASGKRTALLCGFHLIGTAIVALDRETDDATPGFTSTVDLRSS